VREAGAISRAQFAAYEHVRQSGVTNMWDVARVSDLSGLSSETVTAIMEDYGSLQETYPEVVAQGGKAAA